jgi:ubiquinone/menaquinone biosynthesis C-methylase UbiE
MSQGGIYEFIDQADETTLHNIIQRLEFRDRDPTFTGWRNEYLGKLDFKTANHILDVGCGTGVVTRALARRDDFSGIVAGADQSHALIEAAQRLAAEVHLDDRVQFKVSDIHALDYDDASFDIVVAHTVLSHVSDLLAAMKELARVTRPQGKVVVFDSDFAALTFAYPPDAQMAKTMNEALLKVAVSNPNVMREMLLLLREVGLKRVDTMSYVLAEVGTGSYWASFMETFAPLVAKANLLSQEKVTAWLEWQRQAVADGIFFAYSNFYTYIARRL